MQKKYLILGFIIMILVIFNFPVFSQATPDPGEIPLLTEVEEPEFPFCADGNADGFVDIVDALLVAQCYVSINCHCSWPPCPDDVNCDGKLDIIDALLIAQYYVGLRDSLCCY